MKKVTPTLRRRLAARLKRFRSEMGMTQGDLAEKVDCSVAYVSLLERAGRAAPLDTVDSIAAALKVDPAELLRTEG